MWFKTALVGVVVLVGLSRADAQSLSCGSVPPLAQVGSTKEQQLNELSRMAFACVKAGKLDLAIDIFSEIINLDPTNEKAYLNRASAYLQSRQFQLGIADLSHVISVKPTFAEAWYNRGIAFLAGRKYERAVADFGEALRLNPDFARAYCNRGLALVRKGAYDEALKDLKTGLEKDPSLPLCQLVRGDVQFQKGNYSKAVDDYTRGLAKIPNIEALSRRAEAYEKLGEREKALADFEAVLKHAPRHNRANQGIARLRED